MKTLRTIAGVREALAPVRAGRRIGLVPTMGALHRGHESLVRAARDECDVVVVSIFVNPAQFGPADDLALYPRDERRDARLAGDWAVDLLFVPAVEEMYPEGFSTWVEVEGVSEGLEGAARPGHFRGVATVCLKLFTVVRPDRAYFGRKDAQQAAVVARMARDLDLDLEICVLPTVREEDGVAASSRNAYLSPAEREAARALPRALAAGAEAFGAGGDAEKAAGAVLAGAPGLEPEYVEVARLDGQVYLFAAARAGRTRLIDNVVLEGEHE